LTERQQNICVVGDPDQSIYRWRGADITNILKFEEHFPSARVIRLEENYRSTQNILDVASGVIKHNVQRKEKALWTQNSAGEKIRYYQALDAESEARFVAGKIEEHLRREPGIRAAVLYRTNSQSRVFEEAMRRASLAYNIVGGFSFYERMEVRDIIAYLKLAMNPHDSIALQRVINTPTRGIGKMTLDEIDLQTRELGTSYWDAISSLIRNEQRLSPRAAAALANFQSIINGLTAKVSAAMESDSPVSDVVKAAIFDSGYENALKAENNDEAEARLENLQELVNAAVDYDEQGAEGLRDFIDHSALVADTDQYKSDFPVTLMTAHSAKGLEFPLVFLVGLEEGLFPHSRSSGDASGIEEERRLAYVAMTRAEKYLYVTHAVRRRVYGEELASEPSPFLNEMPSELIDDLSRGRSWLSFARESKDQAPGDDREAGSLEYEYDESANEAYEVPAGEPATSDRLSARRPGKKYSGKTYDSVESIEEFFRKRSAQMGSRAGSSPNRHPQTGSRPGPEDRRGPSYATGRSTAAENEVRAAAVADFLPGSYVRHAKYGRGLVLRREGSGDQLKLTVSFPGYGQKKLIEKYAGLEKA